LRERVAIDRGGQLAGGLERAEPVREVAPPAVKAGRERGSRVGIVVGQL
jgi:hypothetical protein